MERDLESKIERLEKKVCIFHFNFVVLEVTLLHVIA